MDHVENDESGISLIEVVVSMFMIALLALAFLPFLIRSYQVSGTNSTLSTATQVLNKEFDQLRLLQPANCAQLTSFRDSVVQAKDTARNVTLKVQRTFSCPTTTNQTGTQTMTIAVLNAATNAVVVQGKTLVYVGATP